MNVSRSTICRSIELTARRAAQRRAFTLIEILVVLTIIGIMVTMMGAVITNTMKKAREAATISLIQKIEGLLDERIKGFDRMIKSRDFQRYIETRKKTLERGEDINGNSVLDPGEDTNGNAVLDRGIYGVSFDVIEAVTRKDFMRQNFPQRYEDMTPLTTTGLLANVPTAILTDPTLVPEDTNVNGVLNPGEDLNGNGKLDGYIHYKHLNPPPPLLPRETESAALLYFAITRMQIFGVPPVGESEFSTSEVRDTDGDGLLEFIDGWGRPLRFYRWPTRLLKPNGIKGLDNQYGAAGVDDDGNGTVDDFPDFGKVGTDDITVPRNPANPVSPTNPDQRAIAGLLIDGLSSYPSVLGQWDPLSEDPDDPYGLITAELKRQFITDGRNFTLLPFGYPEGPFPTLDTYHTPLIVSLGADGDLGLFEPFQGTDSNGDGVLDSDLGILAQPKHGPLGPYDITSSVTSTTTDVISALTDNITNRNRRAGRGK